MTVVNHSIFNSIFTIIKQYTIPISLSLYPAFKSYQIGNYILDDSDGPLADDNTNDAHFKNSINTVSIGFAGITSLVVSMMFEKIITSLIERGYKRKTISTLLCLIVAVPILAKNHKHIKKRLTSTTSFHKKNICAWQK